MEHGAIREVLSAGQILDQAFAERKSRRPRYSLRAFARDLGVSHTLLSLIRRGRYSPSTRACMNLSQALGIESTWGSRLHRVAQQSLVTPITGIPRSRQRFTETSADNFVGAMEWYDLALLDLSGLEDFNASPRWCARRLGISPAAVTESIVRLEAAGLIRVTKSGWKKRRKLVSIPTPADSLPWLRAFHEALIGRALRTLSDPSRKAFQARDITAALIPIDPTRLPEAKKRIARFRRELLRFLSSGQSTELYALNVQLIPLAGDEP